MAAKHRRKRGFLAVTLGLLCAGSTAPGALAQDFLSRYAGNHSVTQVGYYDHACGGACADGCAGGAAVPAVPHGAAMEDMPMIEMPPIDPESQLSPLDLEAPIAPSPMLAASFGASSGGYSSAPNVIGDFFGGGLTLGSAFAFTPDGMTLPEGQHHQEFATTPIHGGDRLLKITEFNSPIPVDRVFFTYNHFHNAIQESIDGTVVDRNLDRFVFGAEKTFNNGNSSIELRLPVVAGLDATQNTGDTISEEAVLFGDISLALKTILLVRPNTIWTGGLGMTLPTGPDANITFFGQTLQIDNEAVHLSPFLGVLYTPNQNLFLQGFVQFNFDLNGNSFVASTGPEGVIQDQTLMFLSGTIGYWIARDYSGASYITGIAPVLELHYTSTLNDADTDGAGGSTILVNDGENRIDVLNLTAGTHFQLGPMSTLTVAAVVPLKDGENKLFDTEIGVQFNRRF